MRYTPSGHARAVHFGLLILMVSTLSYSLYSSPAPVNETQQLKEKIEQAVTDLSNKDTTAVVSKSFRINGKSGGLILHSNGSKKLAVAKLRGKVVIFTHTSWFG